MKQKKDKTNQNNNKTRKSQKEEQAVRKNTAKNNTAYGCCQVK